jgi:hypothetical protein
MAAKRQPGTKRKRSKLRKEEAQLRRRREILEALMKVLRGA